MTQKSAMLCVLLGLLAFVQAALAGEPTAREILRASGAEGGLVVHLGCGDGKLTAALHANESYLVQGLDTAAAHVAKARAHIRSLDLYGKVSVDTFDGRHLPYIDNLVNLVVAEGFGLVPIEEVMRVLAPGGTVYLRDNVSWSKIEKPWPGEIDEWTHFLHGPDNNAVAHDTVVGPPRHMQWLGGPRWSRNHHKLASISSVVTANGRLLSIVDEATSANISVPSKWSIVARDAFSGVRLWKKRIESWAWHQIPFRSGPPQLTRLLVASGDRVYAPLGLSRPVSRMDAATGKTLKTYEQTAGAEEIILVDGTLLVLKGRPRGLLSIHKEKGSPVAEQAATHVALKREYRFPNRKTVVALSADSGETLWEWSDPKANPMPETLASDGTRVFIQVGEAVACLDLTSGLQRWISGETGKHRREKLTYGKNTLVVADGVVLCKLSGKLTALSADSGEKLWEYKAGDGFHSPLDVFVIDGQVWLGDHGRDSVAPSPVNDFSRCLDLRTGEVKGRNQILVDLQTSGHHHRCYREKATTRYIIAGKRGIEMMSLASSDHSRNNWIRGTCQYGIMPANGLLYAPPHACGCYMESKLWGFWALSAEQPIVADPKLRVPEDERLEKGPAYGREKGTGPICRNGPEGARHKLDLSPFPADAWPQYRHDPRRSGVAGTALPAQLKRTWTTDIGGRLTQPVVAQRRVLLAAVDAGTVYALDAETGEVIWDYVSGGRVDSPPAVYRAMVLFGSADGWVYCLRLSDGELVWRFLAAAADMRTVAMNRVESVWPVHGSVLVFDGLAYCSAGRSTWLDGGIDLYALQPASGKVIRKAHFESEHPKFRQGKEEASNKHVERVAQNTTDYKTFLAPDRSDSFSMAGGAISDVLVSDGTSVFLRHVKFSPTLERQDEMTRHLFSTSSLLDDAENHRSHWVLGTGDFSRVPVAYSWIVNRPSRRGLAIAVPSGVIMVYTDRGVWAVQRKGDANGRYHIFMKRNNPFSEDEESLPDFRKIPEDQVNQCVWKVDLPVRARAMLKSGERLYLGTMPVEIHDDDPHAAYEGRRGGMIWVVSAQDGSKIAEHELASPTVFDGLAAAHGRLYLATMDGKVLCLGTSRGTKKADVPSAAKPINRRR